MTAKEEFREAIKEVESLARDLTAQEKFGAAKQRLNEIWESSDWYSARIWAGRALGINSIHLDAETSWMLIQILEDATATMEVEISCHIGSYNEYGEPNTECVPDLELREKARVDLEYMCWHILSGNEHRVAKRALGYFCPTLGEIIFAVIIAIFFVIWLCIFFDL